MINKKNPRRLAAVILLGLASMLHAGTVPVITVPPNIPVVPVPIMPVDPLIPLTPVLPVVKPGVITALTTSDYHFTVGMFFPPPAPPGFATPDFVAFGPLAFEASYVLANHTPSDINFTVPRPNVPMGAMAVYVPNIVFRLYDQNDKLIWESWTDPGTFKSVPETLPAGTAWRQQMEVPLRINGQWLHGQYTLMAGVNGAPEFSATTTFNVTQFPVIDPPFPITPLNASGIKGVAVESPVSPVQIAGDPNEQPLAGAIISIKGPAWTGPTPVNAMIALPVRQVIADSKGRFTATLPPGTYEITGETANPASPYPKGSTQNVSVVAGKITDVVVNYDTGIR